MKFLVYIMAVIFLLAVNILLAGANAAERDYLV
jgi:hypothetical protein